MGKETKVLSFASSKGGVGKSTLATVCANYLHNETGLSVAVIDADFGQNTIEDLRNEELKEDKFADVDQEALYPIIVCTPDEVSEIYDQELDGVYDIVIIDLPGSLIVEGVTKAYTIVDHLFIPTKYGKAEIGALLLFIEVINDTLLPRRREMGKTMGITGVLNDINTQFTEYKAFVEIKDNLPIPFMNVDLPRSEQTFIRNFSTILTYEYIPRKGLLRRWCEEIMEIINK